MNRRAIVIFCTFLGLVGFSAVLLGYLRTSHRLGEPGVKVGDVPLRGEDGEIVANLSVLLPEKALDCASTNLPLTKPELEMLPPDTVYGRRYYRGPRDTFGINASVVLMGSDRTSIHKPQYCLVGQGWQIERSEVATVPIASPRPYDLRLMKLTLSRNVRMKDGNNIRLSGLYLYWFVGNEQLTPDHLQRMWWMARDLVTTGVLQRWAYVAYLGACLPGEETALFERMKRMIMDTVPQFQISTGERDRAQLKTGPPALASILPPMSLN
jgi:Protein of unknown function (DUF3485)